MSQLNKTHDQRILELEAGLEEMTSKLIDVMEALRSERESRQVLEERIHDLESSAEPFETPAPPVVGDASDNSERN